MRPPTANIPQAEFADLVVFLAQNGVNPSQAAQAIGESASGRTRREVADDLRIWLQTRPKSTAKAN